MKPNARTADIDGDSFLKIKFSHNYKKLKFYPNIAPLKDALLLAVFNVRLEKLRKVFLDWDTQDGLYKLPKKGKFILLLFAKDDYNLFTTLRRYTPEKEKYYRSKIGYFFWVDVGDK
jgi:hypothetical protein